MRLVLAAALAVLIPLTAAAQPKPVPAPNVPGGKVVLVPRDQLRAGPTMKRAVMPHPVRAAAKSGAIPIPATYDWTKGNTISFPILGNDQWGDCYYACLCHDAQARAALVGSPITFNTSQVVARYKVLSGGDNGLSDEDVIPEYKKGIVGPNGPHKILDTLVVAATDDTAVDYAGYLFGPQWFTFTVYSSFMSQAKPGAFIDSVSGGVDGGHAVLMSGKTARGRKIETWGMSPSVEIGKNFIGRVEPEVVAVFSLEWFDAKGYAPNGQHYQTLAPLWNAIGGKVDPVGPFPPPNPNPPVPPIPPAPPTPPTPPAPVPPVGPFTGSIYYQNGVVVGFGPLPAPPKDPVAELATTFTAGKANPIVILADMMALYAAYQSKDPVAIAAAVAQLLADLKGPPAPPVPPTSAAPPVYPSSVPGATLYGGQCYVDPATGRTVCPQQPERFPLLRRAFRR